MDNLESAAHIIFDCNKVRPNDGPIQHGCSLTGNTITVKPLE
jgi:hypothetical protein